MSTARDTKGRRLFGTTAVALLMLSACGSDEESSSSSEPASSPSELIGAWEATVSNVTWAVTEDVIATTAAGGIETAYTATDTTLEMGEESGANACPSGQIGVYEWEIEDDVLTMTLVSDQCSGRKNALDGISLQRSE